jgi:hypothetical protein
MPKVKASRRSAVTQPKFQSNEVTVKGKRIIINSELAEEVQKWIEHKNRCKEPVAGELTLASVLSGLVGAQLGKQVEAKIVLPADLLAWARHEAYNLTGELSDLVRELLEYERYRTERLCTYVRFPRGKEKQREAEAK